MLAKYTLTVGLLLACFYLMSCTSQIPVPTNYPYTEQQKMQAPSHWSVLAGDVIRKLEQDHKVSKKIPLAVYPKFYFHNQENPVIWTAKQPLTIADESDRLATIPFKRAYQNYLIERLVDAGYNVVDDYCSARFLMTFDIQLVKHPGRRVRSPHIIDQLGRIVAGAVDGAYEGVQAGDYEVVITTSVKSGHTYVMSHTGTYYVDTPPWDGNYAMQGRVMEVVNQ
ncbi:MAG TPA: hypothetical protein VMW16_01015 [Sedimentisphaerales bacterium]|nr:hypothetical protein [Sedimentisphaerales bacterium]